MNEEDVRGVFDDALDQPQPAPSAGVDDIVSAGRAKVRTRYGVLAGASTCAVVAVAVGLFTVFSPGGGAPVAADETDQTPSKEPVVSPTETDGPEVTVDPDDCMPPDDLDNDPVAWMYTDALEAEISEQGGEPGGNSEPGNPDAAHDGFFYDVDICGYSYYEMAIFLEHPVGDNRLTVIAKVYNPADRDGPVEEQAEELAGCDEIDGTCAWEGDALTVTEDRMEQPDEDEGGPEPTRYLGVFLPTEGDYIVQVTVTPALGSLPLEPRLTFDELTEIARAVPAGQDP